MDGQRRVLNRRRDVVIIMPMPGFGFQASHRFELLFYDDDQSSGIVIFLTGGERYDEYYYTLCIKVK